MQSSRSANELKAEIIINGFKWLLHRNFANNANRDALMDAQMFPPEVAARVNQPLIDYRDKMDALANEDAGKFWSSVIELGMQERPRRHYRRRFPR